MRNKRAKSLRMAVGYDMKLDRHTNNEFSRMYRVSLTGTRCVGLREVYQRVKKNYKANTGWRKRF